ncbi:MAG: hydroxyethylthiazole kinase [Candidatus Neomarinimicrobiota bacterium]
MKPDLVYKHLKNVREKAPLVHNITNYVVMNNTANALLAIGASPVMAHAVEEVEDMIKIASTLVINIGTLSPHWVEAMIKAAKAAKAKGIPIVLDPVGAGATPYRSETCFELLETANPAVIRGNASEIMALENAAVKTKGVDSTQSPDSAMDAAKNLANKYNCIVSISGKIDHLNQGEKIITLEGGSDMMPKITGLGCTATALTAAFIAVNKDTLEAAASAMAVMGIAAEMAEEKASGPGTLQLHMLDAFYNMNENDIGKYLK